MSKDEKQIIELFLRDPETDKKLSFVSALEDNGDGTTSFLVADRNSETGWRVTFKIEEVIKGEPVSGVLHAEYNGALDWASKWLTDQASGHAEPLVKAFAENVAGSFLAHRKPWKK